MRFDKKSLDKIGNSVHDFERRPRNRLAPRPTQPRFVAAGLVLGITTSAITKRSGSTLGSGTVELALGSGATITTPSGSPPTYKLYSNDATSGIKTGVPVVMGSFRDGYIAVHADCGDLS